MTNRQETLPELWRGCNGRAGIEQRIEELKHDLAADRFCLPPFFATEAAFLTVLFTFNLLSLYQHPTTRDARCRQPDTKLRTAVFLCGAVLGVMGCVAWFTQTQAAGGCHLELTSPKLSPPEDRLAIGGIIG